MFSRNVVGEGAGIVSSRNIWAIASSLQPLSLLSSIGGMVVGSGWEGVGEVAEECAGQLPTNLQM